MKSPMADANAAIINEVKKFMERAVTDYSESKKYTGEQTKDLTRPRILTFPVLTLMILNAMKRRLSIETEVFSAIPCREKVAPNRLSANSVGNKQHVLKIRNFKYQIQGRR